MRYNVAYSDAPASAATIEAPSSKDAATIFYFQRLTPNDRTILVTAETGQTEEFKTSDLSPSRSTDQSFEIVQTLNRRYADAYTEAHTVVTVGKAIKGIAVFLFIASLLGGFYLASQQQTGSGIEYSIGGFLLACVVAIPIYVLGILVAAQGQTALAMLDTAVNSSRHLNDDDVARILSRRWSL